MFVMHFYEYSWNLVIQMFGVQKPAQYAYKRGVTEKPYE